MGQITKLKHFSSINRAADQYLDTQVEDTLTLKGIGGDEWVLLINLFLGDKGKLSQKDHIFVVDTTEKAEILYDKMKQCPILHRVALFLGPESSPYSSVISSQKEMFQRFGLYESLVSCKKSHCLVTTQKSLFLKGPKKDFFIKRAFSLNVSDNLAQDTLAHKLVELGYTFSSEVSTPGTFCQKGEIFDVHPIGTPPVRLYYYDNVVEEIFEIDMNGQKTLRHRPKDRIFFGVSPLIFLKKEFHRVLRYNLHRPRPGDKEKYEKRKMIFDQLKEKKPFEKFSHYIPLFIEDPGCLLNFFDPGETVIHFLGPSSKDRFRSDLFEGLEREYIENHSIAPSPDRFYEGEWHLHLHNFLEIEVPGKDDLPKSENYLEIEIKPLSFLFGHLEHLSGNRHEYVHSLLEAIREAFKHTGRIIYLYSSKYFLDNFKEAIGFDDLENDFKERVSFFPFTLEEGFYYPEEELLVLPESVIFNIKRKKTKRRHGQKIDFFVDQFSHLKVGDIVIHADFGVGRYKGLQELNMDMKGDFLVIEYRDGDKIYVPSYNVGLVQKCADAHTSKTLDSLRSGRFSRVKSKVKSAVKDIAFNLLELQAQRATEEAFSFSPPDQCYREFEFSFPFVETVDQEMAMADVLEDMQRDRPMDRLICGDVGLGKTEVAMRAAFKAVIDKKQVAMIVPTTILALQHYNSFKERFINFPVEIDFLSRFKSEREAHEVKRRLRDGNIDIIIGTHKLLSSRVDFLDLGLVIVDEEHRFGVSHKEKLKLLKSSVDFLTLTATPIPRTLQLSLLGIRDISLIRTPPPKRQAIKTYIAREDDFLVKKAIEEELSRGGQVFVIYNRIRDIENHATKIKGLTPGAKVVLAHGRLKEDELEKRMSAFCRGEYQILVSTTIVESGLDIPNANTMIVTRADLFGLAQLHQLRGRIGRSDKKAYCYFMIPQGDVSKEADKRLKALQTYVDLGAGLNLANCDLEIRGSGDILGATQAGHIESVGLELYMELLEEAICELKGKKKTIKGHVEITTPFAALIPENYVEDTALRLRYYKRLSVCQSRQGLQEVALEMQDVFGKHPKELLNLMAVLNIKIVMAPLGVSSIKIVGNNIILKPDKKVLEDFKDIRDRMADVFLQAPGQYQLTPQDEVFCPQESPLTLERLLGFSTELREKILPTQ